MRFRSAHAQLRNRLAAVTTRENSPSDHLCQIVPEKRPSHAGIQPTGMHYASWRLADFSGGIPKTQRNLLTGSGLQRDQRIYSSATTSE
jgi:hypothetical protein